VLLVWDPIYSVFNSDPRAVVKLSSVLQNGWIDEPDLHMNLALPGDVSQPPEKRWHIFLSPHDAYGNLSDHVRVSGDSASRRSK